MAELRERPYVQFNFLVNLGTGTTDGAEAGFQEVSGIGMDVTVAEFRTGNERENNLRKNTGLNKATEVTMKRGVIGSLNLYQWLNDSKAVPHSR
jgi:phage tail-like protein